MSGNDFGIKGLPCVMVADPSPAVQQVSQQFRKLQMVASPPATMVLSSPSPPSSPISAGSLSLSPSPSTQIQLYGSPPAYASSPTSPAASPTAIARKPVPRRPVPLSPATVLRVVEATHAFNAVTEDEPSFAAGDTLDVIDDKSDDGWWKASLHGKVGMIPCTFVQ